MEEAGVAASPAAGLGGGVALARCQRCHQEWPYSNYDPLGDGSAAPALSPYCRFCMFDEQLREQFQELLAAQVVDGEEHQQQPHHHHPATATAPEAHPGAAAAAEAVQHPATAQHGGPGEAQTEAQQQQQQPPQQGAAAQPCDLRARPVTDEAQLSGQTGPGDRAAAVGSQSQLGPHSGFRLHLEQQQEQQHSLHPHTGDTSAGGAAPRGAAAPPGASGLMEVPPGAEYTHTAAAAAVEPAAAAVQHLQQAPSALPVGAAAAEGAAQVAQPSLALDPALQHAHTVAAAQLQLGFDPVAHMAQITALNHRPAQLEALLQGGMGMPCLVPPPEAYEAFFAQQQEAAAAAAAAAAALGVGSAAAMAAFAAGVSPQAATAAAEVPASGRKTCFKCKVEKPLEDFPELKGKKKGRAAQCSGCRAALEESRRQRAELASHGGSLPSTSAAAVANALAPRSGSEYLAGAADAGASGGRVPAGAGGMLGQGQPLQQEQQQLPALTDKQCMHCMLVKPVGAFRRSKNKTDKLQNRCKDCEVLLGRGTKRDRSGPVVVKVAHKLCRRCNLDKDASQFFQSKTSLDGLCTYCKACQTELNRQARAKRPEVAASPEVTMKMCRHCRQDRPAEQYFKSKMNVDGLYSYCKGCATVLNSASKKRRRAMIRERRLAAQEGGSAAACSSSKADGAVGASSSQGTAAGVALAAAAPTAAGAQAAGPPEAGYGPAGAAVAAAASAAAEATAAAAAGGSEVGATAVNTREGSPGEGAVAGMGPALYSAGDLAAAAGVAAVGAGYGSGHYGEAGVAHSYEQQAYQDPALAAQAYAEYAVGADGQAYAQYAAEGYYPPEAYYGEHYATAAAAEGNAASGAEAEADAEALGQEGMGTAAAAAEATGGQQETAGYAAGGYYPQEAYFHAHQQHPHTHHHLADPSAAPGSVQQHLVGVGEGLTASAAAAAAHRHAAEQAAAAAAAVAAQHMGPEAAAVAQHYLQAAAAAAQAYQTVGPEHPEYEAATAAVAAAAAALQQCVGGQVYYADGQYQQQQYEEYEQYQHGDGSAAADLAAQQAQQQGHEGGLAGAGAGDAPAAAAPPDGPVEPAGQPPCSDADIVTVSNAVSSTVQQTQSAVAVLASDAAVAVAGQAGDAGTLPSSTDAPAGAFFMPDPATSAALAQQYLQQYQQFMGSAAPGTSVPIAVDPALGGAAAAFAFQHPAGFLQASGAGGAQAGEQGQRVPPPAQQQ